ncbi:protein archease [Exaiptasia diaphana]|uniref:Archease domain-containing protein n=1 Tax=Exaiptasia diaphana TaxID=2652724 RepID=A0A913Y345_EXADI|nr:protein archease [Exaiptasia diaphana]KXJ07097.1 Protein archease [Exaiptasia diaphana]
MAAVESKGCKPKKYEYLDHTADVQLHAWGDDLKEAFEQVAVSMFGYMTELETVDIAREEIIEAEGEDMLSLLFHFLDESLFLMCADPYFIVKEVEITEFDRENFKIKAIERGEEFDLKKHPQGTEVKAITYSNMQIHDNDKKHEVFVIIDI